MDARQSPESQQPIRRFNGSHAHILTGLEALKEVPQLAASLARARASAAATIELFDQVVLRHHAEEEQELFVSVQRSCGDARECHLVRGLVDRLTAQHRAIEKLWKTVRPALVLTAAGKVHDTAGFDGSVRALVDLYAAHAKQEEEEFLPLAEAILGRNPDHMAALGLALHMRDVPAPPAYV